MFEAEAADNYNLYMSAQANVNILESQLAAMDNQEDGVSQADVDAAC